MLALLFGFQKQTPQQFSNDKKGVVVVGEVAVWDGDGERDVVDKDRMIESVASMSSVFGRISQERDQTQDMGIEREL
jgi:hypothetical protein